VKKEKEKIETIETITAKYMQKYCNFLANVL